MKALSVEWVGVLNAIGCSKSSIWYQKTIRIIYRGQVLKGNIRILAVNNSLNRRRESRVFKREKEARARRGNLLDLLCKYIGSVYQSSALSDDLCEASGRPANEHPRNYAYIFQIWCILSGRNGPTVCMWIADFERSIWFYGLVGSGFC